ncbi:MAG: sulfatase-like hydrolase/transferase [Bacteroidota bacterium]
MDKLSLTFYFLCLCVLISCKQATEKQEVSSRPNVLIILTDDQGYADVGCRGAGDMQTPQMDSLFASGKTFTRFYANCPVCSPTRAALLSGRYQEYVGVPGVIRTYEQDNFGYLAPDAVLLPSLFQKAGYHTALIGKWHLGLTSPNTPTERGFTLFQGWLGDMMEDYVHKRRHGINYMRHNEESIDPEGHATDVFTDFAVNYLEERKDQQDPFFLYLAYNAPHFPVQPPQEWVDRVLAREEGIDSSRAKLVAFIEHMDDGIGKVLTTLQETGQAENTLVIFTSDNGGLLRDRANNGPFRDGKQSVYEGGLLVPSCVSWQGRITPNTTTEHMALSMDIFPTVLEAANIPLSSSIEGRSFLPIALGNPLPAPDTARVVFFSRREGGLRYGGKTIEAVRKGKWKLLQNDPFGKRELYNLAEDPYETTDVYTQHPEVVKELNSYLMAHLQRAGAVPWQNPSSGTAESAE